MGDYITKIRTAKGDKQIDYNALANLPDLKKYALVEYADYLFNGANKALSFFDYEVMIAALNALPYDKYNVGQNVMIVTLNVPDLWISGIESEAVEYTYTSDVDFTAQLASDGYVQVGYFKLSALETQKVDLTDYDTHIRAIGNVHGLTAADIETILGYTESSFLCWRGLNVINIDKTLGNWTTDISDPSNYGTLPSSESTWWQVTQFSSQHFFIQYAQPCNGTPALWIRHCYGVSDTSDNNPWTKWEKVATQKDIESIFADNGWSSYATSGTFVSGAVYEIEVFDYNYSYLRGSAIVRALNGELWSTVVSMNNTGITAGISLNILTLRCTVNSGCAWSLSYNGVQNDSYKLRYRRLS